MQGLVAISVPQLPKWLLLIRLAIIFLCLGILIAAAYNISVFPDYIGITSSPAGFLLFNVRRLVTSKSMLTVGPGRIHLVYPRLHACVRALLPQILFSPRPYGTADSRLYLLAVCLGVVGPMGRLAIFPRQPDGQPYG